VPSVNRNIAKKYCVAIFEDNNNNTATAQQELSLYYQPSVDALDHSAHCFGALLRWHNAELASVNPELMWQAAKPL